MSTNTGSTNVAAESESTPGGALKLVDVHKSYSGSRGVGGVSLDIAPGEFLTMLGPSGSGKTTTLNLIAGFLTPDRGQILLDGAEISGTPPHRRGLGMVFQHYALFPHMTIRENVAYPLAVRKVSRASRVERADEALAMVKLEAFADRRPAELSGGQQQRVALARAFVFRPRVLLMDEPLGALDTKLRAHLQTEIARICRELGVTVVYVTHDQEEALALSDRIAIYNEGRIEQVGSARELYQRPCSAFVADFMGESSMISGTIDGTVLHHADGDFVCPRAQSGLVADGADATIVLRPEKVSVARSAADMPGQGKRNTLDATLIHDMYLGPVRKLELTASSGLTVTARIDADSVSDELRVGDRVLVGWDPADSVVVAS